MQPRLSFVETVVYGFIGLVVFLGIWYVLPATGLVPQQFLPGPVTVVELSRSRRSRSPARRCSLMSPTASPALFSDFCWLR